MRRKKPMNLDEHLETADDLAIAFHHIDRVFYRLQAHYGKTSKIMTLFRKITPGFAGEISGKIKCVLDDLYHAAITDEEFYKHGHIYYSLQKRYESISGAKKEIA